MKVVFLDFDGVLNSWRYFKDQHSAGVVLDTPSKQIDRKAVRWVNEVVAATGAKVVISSTWRLLHTLEELRSMLAGAGFVGEVIGVTPDFSWRRVGKDQSLEAAVFAKAQRGDEIEAWLKEHAAVTSFVIFDDDSDMAMHMDRLVQTDARKGLKQKHFAMALALLGAPHARERKEQQ